MRTVACTLISGDYHIGAAALANSLHRCGYRGAFYVFHRGPQPCWDAEGTFSAPDRLDLQDMSVRFVPDEASEHIALRKPACLQTTFAMDTACEAVAFIDADVVIRAPWHRIEHWLSCGVAVCVDGWMPQTPEGHNPLRMQWREAVIAAGRQPRQLTAYFNSGFLGVPRRHVELVSLWRTIIDYAVARSPVPITGLHLTDRTDPFFSLDQDALNAALMGVDAPISALGTEGMGFSGFGTYMTHFATSPKPWQTRYFLRALDGFPAPPAERQFWDNLNGPIRPLSEAALRWRKIDLAAGKLLSRFYARPGSR